MICFQIYIYRNSTTGVQNVEPTTMIEIDPIVN